MMSRLKILLFGTFQVLLDDQPITGFRSDKARALLIYLAVEAGRPHARRSLAALLWPDASDAAALTYLRGALANLRQLLGDDQAQPQKPSFLQSTRDTIQLDMAAGVWLDTAAFAAACAGNPKPQALENAVTLCRGPFLDGFSIGDGVAFDEWLMIEREHFNRKALSALQVLAAAAIDQQRYLKAEDWARRQLVFDPWDELAHRQLMTTLALDGKRGAAIVHFTAFRDFLVRELGVEPAPETIDLHERIRNGEAVANVAPAPRAGYSATTSVHDLSIFVARASELAYLNEQLELAVRGAGRAVFVRGDAGSGKTALLHEFGRRTGQRHTSNVVAEGRCSDTSGDGDTYMPFREIVHALMRTADSGDPGLNLGVFWSGRHATRSQRQMSAETTAGALGQNDLFEQVTAFLQEMAARRPLILLLDDLQWADSGSLRLLFYLSRRLTGSRILIVGAYRAEDVSQNDRRTRHPLAVIVHELQRDFGEPGIDLDQIDGQAFVDAFLDNAPNRLSPAFRSTLCRHTEGQALFTVELIQAMKERGALVQNAVGQWIEGGRPDWENLPPRVEAVIAERIERLPAQLRMLLEMASVEGEVFSVAVLANLSSMDEGQLVWSLSELLGRQHRLVQAETHTASTSKGQRLARYRFAHSLYRTYVYGHLDSVRRAYLHEHVGVALETWYQDDLAEIAVTLAWHFEKAGCIDKAIEYRRMAGDQAMRLSTCENAIDHCAVEANACGN